MSWHLELANEGHWGNEQRSNTWSALSILLSYSSIYFIFLQLPLHCFLGIYTEMNSAFSHFLVFLKKGPTLSMEASVEQSRSQQPLRSTVVYSSVAPCCRMHTPTGTGVLDRSGLVDFITHDLLWALSFFFSGLPPFSPNVPEN